MARTAARRRVHSLALTKARINLGAVVKRVHLNKEYFILEKDGIPIAGLMDIDEFEDYLELQDPTVRAHIRRSYQEYRAGKGRPMEQFLKDLRQREVEKSKRPIATRFQPFAFSGALLRVRLTGDEPSGDYTWLAALTHPGTLTVIGATVRDPFRVE